MTEMVRCPFPPCHATIELRPTRSSPYGDVPDTFLIAAHDVEPDSWYGRCPASFLEHPLSPAARELLDQQLRTFRGMANSYRGPDKGIAGQGGNAAGEHTLWPKPTGSNGWLEPSETNKAATKGAAPSTGGNVASVGNLVAAIGAAGEALGEGVPLIVQAKDEVERSRIVTLQASEHFVRASGVINERLMGQTTSGGLVGTASSQVIQAINAVDQAANAMGEAIEQLDTAIAEAHGCAETLDDYRAAVAN
jgi:hypothetical protein